MFPVEGHDHLYRDEKTGAIINQDVSSYQTYLQMKKKKKKDRAEIDEMKNDLVEEYQTVSAIDEEELSLEYTESEDDQNFKENENKNIEKSSHEDQEEVLEAQAEVPEAQEDLTKDYADDENKFDVQDQDLSKEDDIS